MPCSTASKCQYPTPRQAAGSCRAIKARGQNLKKAATQTTAARRMVKLKTGAKPPGPDERYDANIDHILRAAASVFAEKSFGLASVRDIGPRADIVSADLLLSAEQGRTPLSDFAPRVRRTAQTR